MSRLSLTSTAMLTAGAVRQMFVLSAIVRSRRFLHPAAPATPAGPACGDVTLRFFIVVPVLREAALLRESAAHFQAMARGHDATVMIVTTARETAEAHRHQTAGDTIALARELACQGRCVHVHHPDRTGLKADQLNYAVACCARMLPASMPATQAFVVCYDADSRPPLNSLACLADTITSNLAADVFHQSSRFELRSRRRPGTGLRMRMRLGAAVCDAGALRANRFVLGFEIPRLVNRSAQVSALKRALCSGVYAHVTSHGLCVRLSLLERLPFPARSPLEDMHYSFILGSRGQPMVAVPSLDIAEVPGSVAAQFEQAARWFFGPARFARYLKDPATRPGWRARVMAASAAGAAAEWLGCAVLPALTCVLAVAGRGALRKAAAGFAAVCAMQVVLTETWLGVPGRLGERLTRVMAFPLACTVHGAGGIAGAARLLAGGSGAGKAERDHPA